MRVIRCLFVLFAVALATIPRPHRDSPERDRRAIAPGDSPVSLYRWEADDDGVELRFGPDAAVRFTPARLSGRQPGPIAWTRTTRTVECMHDAMIERYVFGRSRVEQLFVLPVPLSPPLAVHIPSRGAVVPAASPWRDTQMIDGGLWFLDAAGQPLLAYYGANVVDAAGRSEAIAPAWRDGEIVLAVPDDFLAAATFPVVVDPWIELGGSATGDGISAGLTLNEDAAIALDKCGAPVVAWEGWWNGRQNVYLKRWNDETLEWTELGGSGSGTGLTGIAVASFDLAQFPAVIVDPYDRPVVAWLHISQPTAHWEIRVRRWNPVTSAWEGLGGSASFGGISGTLNAFDPCIAADAAGNILVAWEQLVPAAFPGNREIHLKRWNEAAQVWEELAGSATGGGLSATPAHSTTPSLALDAAGQPTVAWSDDTPWNAGPEIYVRRWNPAAAQWEELGGSASAGGVSATFGQSERPSLAMDPEGRPVVAWTEQVGAGAVSQIYLRRWSPASGLWEALGDSASGGGLSATALSSFRPSLGVDRFGRPAVAYNASGVDSGPQVYVRRWNPAASTWDELEGSATGGGVSNTAGNQWFPALAVDRSGSLFVSWTAQQASGEHTYVRARIESAPPEVGPISLDAAVVTPGTVVTTSATFLDDCSEHTAEWAWGDGTSSPGVVVQDGQQGFITGAHAYVASGFYTVTLTVTDAGGLAATSVFQYVVVIATDGFVTGVGWMEPPSGATRVGLNCHYLPGNTLPSGETQLQAPGVNFHTTSLDWLVVSGSRTIYRGHGTVNGGGNFALLVSALDGATDLLRVRIWDETTGSVIYDNEPGAADDTVPVTPVQGNIVIHP